MILQQLSSPQSFQPRTRVKHHLTIRLPSAILYVASVNANERSPLLLPKFNRPTELAQGATIHSPSASQKKPSIVLVSTWCGTSFCRPRSQYKQCQQDRGALPFCGRSCAAHYRVSKLRGICPSCLRSKPKTHKLCTHCRTKLAADIRFFHRLAKRIYCKQCNKLFRPKGSKPQFCSRACWNAYSRTHGISGRKIEWTLVQCMDCGRVKYVKPSVAKKQHEFYCDNVCQGRYCSDNGQALYPILSRKQQQAIHEYGPNWPTQRQNALIRDDFACQICGTSENPQVHHIVPRREFADDYLTANQLSNLITLCLRHHAQREWKSITVQVPFPVFDLEEAPHVAIR